MPWTPASWSGTAQPSTSTGPWDCARAATVATRSERGRLWVVATGRPEELGELERDGWQLLLWSYRHELGLEDDQDQDDGTHGE